MNQKIKYSFKVNYNLYYAHGGNLLGKLEADTHKELKIKQDTFILEQRNKKQNYNKIQVIYFGPVYKITKEEIEPPKHVPFVKKITNKYYVKVTPA